MGYGQRVRITRLWQSHEEFLDKVIRVAGWAKNVRKQGASLVFVELNDGSCFKNIQVVIDETAPGFADVAKSIVGSSFIFKGTLIKSPGDK